MWTPENTSPYCLIQEELRDRPWRMLVACMMLNLTSRKQAQPVWEEFFRRYPTPHSLIMWNKLQLMEELRALLRPLGLQNRRAEGLWKMSVDYVVLRPERNSDAVLSIHGIGKYASDSWRIFVDRELVDDVQDKELRKYVDWAKAQVT